ncbi:hypothetical protein [uncultured Desulfovibrio sp.]|uniref:hypothetical protein n=1 Tax=uncultured Desulfovibrio sp. TaxID=167968 RepID=UPI0025F2371B|nr:hypothetical protein [uncultured Desulfovibrio sp.]
MADQDQEQEAQSQPTLTIADIDNLNKGVRLHMARSACLLMSGDRNLSPRDAVLDVYQVYRDILKLC